MLQHSRLPPHGSMLLMPGQLQDQVDPPATCGKIGLCLALLHPSGVPPTISRSDGPRLDPLHGLKSAMTFHQMKDKTASRHLSLVEILVSSFTVYSFYILHCGPLSREEITTPTNTNPKANIQTQPPQKLLKTSSPNPSKPTPWPPNNPPKQSPA